MYLKLFAYFDIVPLKIHWAKWSGFSDIDRCRAVITTVDKHELFRILNRGLFSLWVNCPHDLAVKTQALREFFILHFATTWKRILIKKSFISISCVHFEWVFKTIWHEITFKQRKTFTMLASPMTKTRCIREDMYVKHYTSFNISREYNIESIRVRIRSELTVWTKF